MFIIVLSCNQRNGDPKALKYLFVEPSPKQQQHSPENKALHHVMLSSAAF